LLLLALNEAGRAGLGSSLLIGPILVFLAMLIEFVRREQRTKSPLIDLSLFRNPVFVAGNAAGLLSYAVLFGIFSDVVCAGAGLRRLPANRRLAARGNSGRAGAGRPS
jgi:hypothetical protein